MLDPPDPDDDSPEAEARRARYDCARRAKREWDDVDRFDSGAHGKVAMWRGEGLSFEDVLMKLGLDPGDEDVSRGINPSRS